MAKISFEAYVNERNGKRLNVSEEYRRKNGEQWETTGHGRYTVWLKDDQAQPEIQAGTVILVDGTQQVTYSEKDGVKYTNVNVSFAKVGVIRQTKSGGGQQRQSAPASEPWGQPAGQRASGWATPGNAPIGNDEPPF